jgi:hypothetical protein
MLTGAMRSSPDAVCRNRLHPTTLNSEPFTLKADTDANQYTPRRPRRRRVH